MGKIIVWIYTLCVVWGMLLHAAPDPSRRFTSVQDALGKANDDGIIVFLYGPGWNRRSVALLHRFWESDAVQQASGGALLVAQAVEPDQASLPQPLGAYLPVCPSLIFLDKNGEVYAYMSGMDAIGNEEGNRGLQNIRVMLDRLRQRNGLMAQSRNSRGANSAEFIHKAAEIPFPQPHYIGGHFPSPEYTQTNPRVRFASMIRRVDPADSRGYARSLLYNPVSFMYSQLNTRDGFLSPRFAPNYEQVKAACLQVANNNALRPEDRQQAYALLIGLAHSNKRSPNEIGGFISALSQLDASSFYGRLSPTLMQIWAGGSSGKNSGKRKAPKPHHSKSRSK